MDNKKHIDTPSATNSAPQPFFARYLERERARDTFPSVKTDVKAGGTSKIKDDLNHTLKYPSDGDEI